MGYIPETLWGATSSGSFFNVINNLDQWSNQPAESEISNLLVVVIPALSILNFPILSKPMRELPK